MIVYMFNSTCYLQFLSNYLRNLLAISSKSCFKANPTANSVQVIIAAHLTFDSRYNMCFSSFTYSFSMSAGVMKESHLTFNVFHIPDCSQIQPGQGGRAETCQGLPWRSSSTAGSFSSAGWSGGWMQQSKLWTLKVHIIHFCSM